MREIPTPWGGRLHCGDQVRVWINSHWRFVRYEVDREGEPYFVGQDRSYRLEDVDAMMFVRCGQGDFPGVSRDLRETNGGKGGAK